jgi:integrase
MLSDKFIKELEAIIDKYEDMDGDLEFIEKLKNLCKNYNNKPAKMTTYVTRLSLIKKYLKDNFEVNDDILKAIKADKNIYDDIKKHNDKVRSNKTNTVVDNKTILKMLDPSKNLYDNLIYVLLCTGRRINEILDCNNIVKKRLKKNEIVFSYLSKKKDKRPANIKILNGCSCNKIIKMIKDIRMNVEILDLNKNEITKRVDRRLKKLDSNLTPHKLRGLYAIKMYNSSDKKQNINGFITDILHHDSSEVSLNYNKYIITE